MKPTKEQMKIYVKMDTLKKVEQVSGGVILYYKNGLKQKIEGKGNIKLEDKFEEVKKEYIKAYGDHPEITWDGYGQAMRVSP